MRWDNFNRHKMQRMGCSRKFKISYDKIETFFASKHKISMNLSGTEIYNNFLGQLSLSKFLKNNGIWRKPYEIKMLITFPRNEVCWAKYIIWLQAVLNVDRFYWHSAFYWGIKTNVTSPVEDFKIKLGQAFVLGIILIGFCWNRSKSFSFKRHYIITKYLAPTQIFRPS